MRPVFQWDVGSRVLELGKRTCIMGVVNVTPDSFSDGGSFLQPERAVQHALDLIGEGADIIDIGGESTRPGARVQGPAGASTPASAAGASSQSARAVTEKDELERVIPVIRGLRLKNKDVLISVDTYKSAVAQAAVREGAQIVNDVSGFRWDPTMARAIGELKCGAILMHMRGRPEEWHSLSPAEDVVLLVKRELKQWAEAAVLAGIKRYRLVIDPGFGFGKSLDQNYPLLRRLEELQQVGFPLLVGISRKSFIGRTLARDGEDAPVDRRLFGTLAAETAAILKGAHIIRTHDVRAAIDAIRVADRILQ